MKLWSREALMIGGIYSVLSAPFLILKTPIGWLPYFLIIGIFATFICAGVFSWNDNVLNRTIGVFNLICSWGLPVSLIVAYIRTKIKVI